MKLIISADEWVTILKKLNIKISNVNKSANRIMCLCPFHNERKASFSVNLKNGWVYCYGCQASYDVINFVSVKLYGSKGYFLKVLNFLNGIIKDNKAIKEVLKNRKDTSKNKELRCSFFNSLHQTNKNFYFLKGIDKSSYTSYIINNNKLSLSKSFLKLYMFNSDAPDLIINFKDIGYYLYSKDGNLIGKILDSNIKLFDIKGVEFLTSEVNNKTNYKMIKTTIITENPIYYILLKNKGVNISLGVVDVSSELNFETKYIIYSLQIIDDGTNNIKKRADDLYKWYSDCNINWFFKILTFNNKEDIINKIIF